MRPLAWFDRGVLSNRDISRVVLTSVLDAFSQSGDVHRSRPYEQRRPYVGPSLSARLLQQALERERLCYEHQGSCASLSLR